MSGRFKPPFEKLKTHTCDAGLRRRGAGSQDDGRAEEHCCKWHGEPHHGFSVD